MPPKNKKPHQKQNTQSQPDFRKQLSKLREEFNKFRTTRKNQVKRAPKQAVNSKTVVHHHHHRRPMPRCSHPEYTVAAMHAPSATAPVPPPRQGQTDALCTYVATRGCIQTTITAAPGEQILVFLTPDGGNLASVYKASSLVTGFPYPDLENDRFMGSAAWDDNKVNPGWSGLPIPWVGGVSPISMILNDIALTDKTATMAPLSQFATGRVHVTASASWESLATANVISRGDCPTLFGNRRPSVHGDYQGLDLTRQGTNHQYTAAACLWNSTRNVDILSVIRSSTRTQTIVGGGNSSALNLHFPLSSTQRSWIAGGNRGALNGRALGLPAYNNMFYELLTCQTVMVFRNTGSTGALVIQIEGYGNYNCQLASGAVTGSTSSLVDAMIESAPIAAHNPVSVDAVQHRSHVGRDLTEVHKSITQHVPDHPKLEVIPVAPSAIVPHFKPESFEDRLKEVGVTAVEKIGGSVATAASSLLGRLISAM